MIAASIMFIGGAVNTLSSKTLFDPYARTPGISLTTDLQSLE